MKVLDASALLAFLQDEAGAEVVANALAAGAHISALNLAEALTRIAANGADPAAVVKRFTSSGLLGSALIVEPFTLADAVAAAQLRPVTRHLGLSLGDRGCLALGQRLASDVLTADTAWSDPSIDELVQVTQIR